MDALTGTEYLDYLTNPHTAKLDAVVRMSNASILQYLTESGGNLIIGGASHHVAINVTTGNLTLVGNATQFRDELGDASKIKVNGVGIVSDNIEGTVNFQTTAAYNANPAIADFAWSNFQLNHDWKNPSSIAPHVHYWQTGSATPNFLFEYRWQINGGAKTTAWTLLTAKTQAFTYTSGTLNQIATSVSGIAAPANPSISDILQLRVYRDVANTSTLFTGADTHGDAHCSAIDIHLEVDGFGSNTEYSKA